MGDALIVFALLIFVVLIVIDSASNSDHREKCKSLGMVAVRYDGKNYCTNIQDLR